MPTPLGSTHFSLARELLVSISFLGRNRYDFDREFERYRDALTSEDEALATAMAEVDPHLVAATGARDYWLRHLGNVSSRTWYNAAAHTIDDLVIG